MTRNWSTEQDNLLREQYEIYKGHENVFKLIEDFMEDDGILAEEIALRLVDLKVIDKQTYQLHFPLKDVSNTNSNVLSPEFLDKIGQYCKEVLESREMFQETYNPVEWLLEKLQDARNSKESVFGTMDDIVLLPVDKKDELVLQNKELPKLLRFLKFTQRLETVEETQKKCWVIPSKITLREIHSYLKAVKKASEQWDKESEERVSKNARKIVEELLGPKRNPIPPWRRESLSPTASPSKPTFSPSKSSKPSPMDISDEESKKTPQKRKVESISTSVRSTSTPSLVQATTPVKPSTPKASSQSKPSSSPQMKLTQFFKKEERPQKVMKIESPKPVAALQGEDLDNIFGN